MSNDKTPQQQTESLSLLWKTESLALAKPFSISRGTKTHAHVVVLTLRLGDFQGWAEAVPYARYHETIDSTFLELERAAAFLSTMTASSTYKTQLKCVEQALLYVTNNLKAGAAKNLLDCALWDLKTKVTKRSIFSLLDIPCRTHVTSAQTLSVSSLDAMVENARQMSEITLIKVKLDALDVVKKIRAIAQVCQNSDFIIDANEAWTFPLLNVLVHELATLRVVLIEQPLPAGQDAELIGFESPIPICADESCHTSADIKTLQYKYSMVNIKLDKTGGLTEALALAKSAKTANLQVMLGCMVASSLAMAPIFALAHYADYVDLDGPVLVLQDREDGFVFKNNVMHKPDYLLWGEA